MKYKELYKKWYFILFFWLSVLYRLLSASDYSLIIYVIISILIFCFIYLNVIFLIGNILGKLFKKMKASDKALFNLKVIGLVIIYLMDFLLFITALLYGNS